MNKMLQLRVLSKRPDAQRLRLCATGELINCLPGTEAKFITKSRSLELLPNRITSAEYIAWICTADDAGMIELFIQTIGKQEVFRLVDAS
jgi:hypothetical protein